MPWHGTTHGRSVPPRARLLWIAGLAGVCLFAVAPRNLGAEPPPVAVGVMVPTSQGEALGAESAAAFELAKRLARAELLHPAPATGFVDAAGKPAALSRFRVLWYHQGDSTNRSPVASDPACLGALREAVSGGVGLCLSGAGLTLLRDLRLEPVVTRLGGPGTDQSPAAVLPAVPDHPLFAGLPATGQPIPLNDGGYPAFSDFHATGGPSAGMLLATTGGGSENPIAEYALGRGRVIAVGWRLPHYAHTDNRHRANLERLTANLIAYLAAPATWRPVVPHNEGLAGASPGEPGLSADTLDSLELAVRDLMASFPDRYPSGPACLARLTELRQGLAAQPPAATPPAAGSPAAKALADLDRRFRDLRREALLANPLLAFDRLLLLRRSPSQLGLPANWQSNSCLPKTGYDNQIAVLSPVRPDGDLHTLYQPPDGRFVGDVDLDFDASRLLFSMPGANGRWQVCELAADGSGFRELPLIGEPDVDNYDACYLPDGNVVFTSTACFAGVPCVTGSSHVANLYRWDRASGRIRQLTFDQDHDWCPTVLEDGRLLYLRWEYTDLPHFVSRILFQANPDGTGQMEYYGSNSYWPNSAFYARPIPGSLTRFVAVISGHHDTARMGELILFDRARGRHEADGAVQRFPGRGQRVEPVIRDALVSASWPKYLHPWPLSGTYVLTACQPTAGCAWGIYLVDTFDNRVLIAEDPYGALLEPIPLAARPRPPVVPPRVDLARQDATVVVHDVYRGPGLQGVPRGTVRQLRLYTYQYAYHGMGGQTHRVGLDGPWDVKRILGTVPVEPDGSAHFRVPANTPIAVHPLDADGRALQLMRSWFTGMPGETVSCTGCHEPQNTALPAVPRPAALARPPTEISPWYGPARGFSFVREVQPVLDAHCVSCHNGQPRPDGRTLPDLQARAGRSSQGTTFSAPYLALRTFVRSPTIESDMHLLGPAEFAANTTLLMRALERRHPDLRLPPEARDRLTTWIDLHAPFHGTWHEIVGHPAVDAQRDRRRDMQRLYADRDEDPEAEITVAYTPPPASAPTPPAAASVPPAAAPVVPDWPWPAGEAARRQAALSPARRTLDLGDGVTLELVRVPAGPFAMGSAAGPPDEQPCTPVTVARPLWIGRTEVTNAQFARFDPRHDSRLEVGDFLQFSEQERGYPVNGPQQPVVRVSWLQARAFCRWLAARTGNRVDLPTEAQWEYACRAGTASDLAYGPTPADFAAVANLADASLRRIDTFGWGLPSGAVPPWRPAAETVDDHHRVTAPVGSYQPNPWGLADLHGNAAEWTRSAFRPYPYREDDGRNADGPAATRRTVRGGSFYDRPQDARSASRWAYPAWQAVFDVGFRVVCEDE